MAQIDIKNCDVFIEDGYDGPGGTPLVNFSAGYASGVSSMVVDGIAGALAVGDRFTVAGDTADLVHTITAHTERTTAAVNHMAGYSTGATAMDVDGISGAVRVGDKFTVAGDTVEHTITAHTETSTDTTNIVFTPALGANVLDDAVITMVTLNTISITFTPALGHAVLNNAAIDILPHSLQIRIGEGNMQWTEKRPIVYVKDRGKLDTVRLGDEEPVEIKMDATWVFLASLSSDLVPTIEEALKRTGPASNWTSSSTDPCEPYAVNIRVHYVPPCSIAGEEYTLRDYRYEDLGHDLKAGNLTTSGKCNVVECDNRRLE